MNIWNIVGYVFEKIKGVLKWLLFLAAAGVLIYLGFLYAAIPSWDAWSEPVGDFIVEVFNGPGDGDDDDDNPRPSPSPSPQPDDDDEELIPCAGFDEPMTYDECINS